MRLQKTKTSKYRSTKETTYQYILCWIGESHDFFFGTPEATGVQKPEKKAPLFHHTRLSRFTIQKEKKKIKEGTVQNTPKSRASGERSDGLDEEIFSESPPAISAQVNIPPPLSLDFSFSPPLHPFAGFKSGVMEQNKTLGRLALLLAQA